MHDDDNKKIEDQMNELENKDMAAGDDDEEEEDDDEESEEDEPAA